MVSKNTIEFHILQTIHFTDSYWLIILSQNQYPYQNGVGLFKRVCYLSDT